MKIWELKWLMKIGKGAEGSRRCKKEPRRGDVTFVLVVLIVINLCYAAIRHAHNYCPKANIYHSVLAFHSLNMCWVRWWHCVGFYLHPEEEEQERRRGLVPWWIMSNPVSAQTFPSSKPSTQFPSSYNIGNQGSGPLHTVNKLCLSRRNTLQSDCVSCLEGRLHWLPSLWWICDNGK